MIIERIECEGPAERAAALLASVARLGVARRELGLAAGAWGCRSEGGAGRAIATWEHAHVDRAALEADRAARAASDACRAAHDALASAATRVHGRVEAAGALLAEPAPAVPLDAMAIAPRAETFTSGPHQLTGLLYLPPGAGPWPVVVFNHTSALAQGTPDGLQTGLATVLLGWGLAFFAPHRRGYGASPGPPWRAECTAPEFSEAYNQQLLARVERERDDVVAACEHLATLREIRADRVALMGTSFGAITSLLAAAERPARGVLAFAPGAMNWERNPLLVARLVDAAPKARAPVMLAQAANDFTPRPTHELAAAIARDGGAFDARVYPPFGASDHAGHAFGLFGAHVWGPRARAFLARCFAD